MAKKKNKSKDTKSKRSDSDPKKSKSKTKGSQKRKKGSKNRKKSKKSKEKTSKSSNSKSTEKKNKRSGSSKSSKPKVSNRSSKHKASAKTAKDKSKDTKDSFFERPALIGILGFILQFVLSVASYYEDILSIPYDKVFWGIGVLLIFGGFTITYLYQQEHEKLEEDVLNTVSPKDVSDILTGGVYGFVRHPGYLGTIMMHLGMAFASRSYLPLIFALMMTIFWVLVALKEEHLLKDEFAQEYKKYAQKVKWRFVPGLY
jgi:protein-S-isoprenylcysteine O-methyltransferase Ste14